MSESIKRAVQAALLRLLHPLAKLLLQAGFGIGDFLVVAKLAYVRAAREQGQESGAEVRRPNISRISVVTGLTRVEVAAILAAAEGAGVPLPDRGRQRAERVLSGWWNDRDFHDERGQPALLAEKGPRRSFASVCQRYSGDPQFAAILDELIRVRAVRRRPDGRVEAVSRTYATVRWSPEGVIEIGEQLGELCGTLVHNLKNPSRPHIVKRVFNSRLDPRWAPMLIRDLEQQIATTAESMDDALNFPEYTLKGPHGGEAMRLGVGIYLFEEGATEGDSLPQEAPRRRTRRSREK